MESLECESNCPVQAYFVENSCLLSSASPRPGGVTVTAHVSRSINGTDCWPMILTMTALVSSWTGSSSHLAVYVGKLKFLPCLEIVSLASLTTSDLCGKFKPCELCLDC